LEALLVNVVESNQASPIVLDLSDVGFIDAHSIGLIVAASTAVSRDGGGLRVRGLHGLPERLFRLLGLGELLTDNAADVYPGVQIGGPHGPTTNLGGGSDFGGRTHGTG
jgi:anti-anti-sigma factor